jgi:non-ribosomal peptide synthetase component F
LNAYNDILAYGQSQKINKSKFKDFLRWLQTRGNKDKQEKFWKHYLLRDSDKKIDIDKPEKFQVRRKKREIRSVSQYIFPFPGELNEKLLSFVKQHKITLSSLLTGGWGLLLREYNGVEDIIFNTTVSGRRAKMKGIEDMVGMFINTLPLRVRALSSETIEEVLARLEAESRQREEYENTSLSDINEYLETYSVYPGETLFDSVLILENYPLDQQLIRSSPQLSVESFSIFGMTQYDVTLIITIFDGIKLDITYNNDCFDEETIERLVRHFIFILEEMVRNPLQTAADLKVLSDAAREELRQRFLAVQPGEAPTRSKYIAPRDTLEKKLVSVWSEVLKVDKSGIGIDDDFFDFGGHSLKVSLLVSRIHRVFDVKVPLEEVFKRPTIRQLGEYIRGCAKERYPGYEAIESAEERDYYELSSVQHRMFALQQLDPESTAYNVSSVMEVEGPVDNETIERFEEAFRHLIQRYESLRTSFIIVDGKPVQRIQSKVFAGGGWQPRPIRRPPEAMIQDFIKPFDLARAPLLRVCLAKINEHHHLLMLDMHHMITDGFSMDIFIKEFTALCRGEDLPGLKKQYKDFSQWQYSCLQSGKFKPQEDYWLARFPGEVPMLNLLTDFARQTIQSFEGERIYFVLDHSLTRQVYQLVRAAGATLFMVLLAVFNVLLSRYTGQEDIVIGTTVAGRRHPDLENIVGVFIETLAIRNHPTGDKTFAAFLQEVRAHTLAAYENESYPFRELVKKTGGDTNMSHNPLFNVMLIVQNVDIAELEVEGLKFSPYPYYSKASKLDLTLEAVETEGEIRCHLEYCTALFKKETMARLKDHFINILREVAANPGQQLSEIDILNPEEKQEALGDFKERHWEPDSQSFPGDQRIETLFEQQAARTPDHIAVVVGHQQFTYLTYRQLSKKANTIAKRIEEL